MPRQALCGTGNIAIKNVLYMACVIDMKLQKISPAGSCLLEREIPATATQSRSV